MNWVVPLWFGFLVAMAFLFEKQTRWISRFNIFTVLLIGLFLRYGVAVPFSDNVNPEVTKVPITHPQLVNYYIAVVLAYVGILGGAFIAARLSGRWSWKFVGSDWQIDTRALYLVSGAIFVLVAVVWILVPWQSLISGISLFATQHSGFDFRGHRVAYGAQTLYSSSLLAYAGSFARYALMPAIVWILFFHGRASTPSRVLFGVAIAILAVIGLASGQKMPAILLLVTYVVAQLVESGWRRFANWKVLTAVILVVLAIPVLYKVQYPQFSYAQEVQIGVSRMTTEYSRSAQLRFIFYPDRHPFLDGLNSFIVRRAAHALGINTGDAQAPETYIPNTILGPQYQGTWNAGFFAEAWADFGFPGVIVGSLLVGIILALISEWYRRSPQGPAEIGTYAAVCLSALFLSEVSLTTALWTYGLLSSFLVYLALRLFPRRETVLQPAPANLSPARPV